MILGLTITPAPSAGGASTSPVGRVRWGYYVPYDAKSLESLSAHLGDLDYVSPFWFQIDGQGNLSRMYAGKDDQDAVERLIKGAGVKIVPTVKNEPRGQDLHAVLAEGAARSRAVGTIVDLVVARGYDGIHIDFEDIAADDRPNLTAFMADLYEALHQKDKLVTQAVAAKTEEKTTGWAGAYDYAALAQYNDLIVLMAYGYGTAKPGSTAPISWVEGSVEYAVSQIPREKLILGVPFYGYHWNNTTGQLVGSLRFSESIALAQSHNAAIAYDQAAQGSHFTYWEGGQQHEVWFEDRRSLDARLDFVAKYGLGGAAGWRLGHEDPQVWESFAARLGFRTWYLAEGATAKPYHTWILVMNPNQQPANITVTFMKEGGDTVVRSYRVAPTSRLSIFANSVVPNAAISTRVDSDRAVIVERAMYFGYDGHVSAGVNAPRYRWYLPGHDFTSSMDTWILVMNPNPNPATATVTFLKEDGDTLVKEYQLPPTSRLNIWANQILPNTAFSAVVDGDQPLVAEQATYFNGGKGGNGSMGSSVTATDWYFAEGYTGYDTWLTIMNPNPAFVAGEVTFFNEYGTETVHRLALGPTSRSSIYLNRILPPNTPFGARLSFDNPIVAERSSYWANRSGGHSSLGATAPATTWYLAEGSTAPPFDTWLLVMNPNPMNADITVTFMREDGVSIVRGYPVGPHSRLTLRVSREVPNSAFSMKVESSQPVVVERSMYFGIGGTNTVGVAQ